VLSEIFRAISTKFEQRKEVQPRLPSWTDKFPYIDGDLFSGNMDVPCFNRAAHTYLIHAGSLDWKQINPDVFGSMIQAVADDAERSNLGLHYTSVPNILKVLGPLFLDDLRAQLSAANTNKAKLLDLRKRMAHIRVFDPACGSGNFLIIAYKEMRAIEFEINKRCDQADCPSDILLSNFRGIELRDFPAKIARLALIIAAFQCDVQYLGSKVAIARFLSCEKSNWIICGNALRLDWLNICPPTGTRVKLTANDLFEIPLDQTEIDFQNEGGETYICGNPPYLGAIWQDTTQKSELEAIFTGRTRKWKSLDYVCGWFMKAADYGTKTNAATAFVSTNSVCQGQHVPILWPLIQHTGHQIVFAYTSFRWANLASNNAGVIVVIVGISNTVARKKYLYTHDGDLINERLCDNINPYLVDGTNLVIEARRDPPTGCAPMVFGNMPRDGGNLLLSKDEVTSLSLSTQQRNQFIYPIVGSVEFIRGLTRFCIWINDNSLDQAKSIPTILQRIEKVRQVRLLSRKAETRALADVAYRFGEVRQQGNEMVIVVPRVSSENREFLPIGLADKGTIISDAAFALYNAPLWNMALIASRLHLVWIATVCGKLGTSYRYSTTLGWNTFPVQPLTEKNKMDMSLCAENILLAREEHFPATIADLYEPGKMPENLRLAHDRNDQVIEHIYIGGRFKNDTQRLETLLDLYTKMTTTAIKNIPAKSASTTN
jgi:hypothetical protein